MNMMEVTKFSAKNNKTTASADKKHHILAN